jgi:PAS domain S-box-containing protein
VILYEYLQGSGRQGRRWALPSALLSVCCILWLTIATANAEENQRVLVLYEQGRSAAAVALADREIHEVLDKQTAHHIDLYIEYMNTDLIPEPGAQEKIRGLILQKYRDRQPDVIIAAGPAAVQFMIDVHQKEFPGVPIVICGSTKNKSHPTQLDPSFTGAWVDLDPAKILELAIKLRPDTKQVFVVNGSAPADIVYDAQFREALHGYENRFKFTYLSGLPMSSLLPQLSVLPDHSIILFGAIRKDATGTRFIPSKQSLPMVVNASSAPIFVFADVLVIPGVVGGYVSKYALQGRIAAEDVLKILDGQQARDIPITSPSNVYMFDWSALKRWHINERDLPNGSIVLNRQPAFMDVYGRYIFGALVLLAQLLLIFLLLEQRTKERKIRQHLRDSEARLREAQSIAQCGSWVWDLAKKKAYWSDEMYSILGLTPESVTPSGSLIGAGDDQRYAAKLKRISETDQSYSEEHRIRRPNGEERIVVEAGQPRYNSRQKPLFVIGTLLDVTDMRRAEQVLGESEERFSAMVDAAPVMMWMAGLDKLCTSFNRGWLAFTGRTMEEEIGNGWAAGVHPDDLQRCMKIYFESFDARLPFAMEYRLQRYDGQYRWISDEGSPRFSPDGTFAGYIGCCLDIHDRKALSLERIELARRLMSAQEAERARIARELHDGIGQEIALLGIQMQRALVSTSPNQEAQAPEIQQFSSKLAAIGVHVGRLSHQLHSSELEFLGLTVAVTKLCREFSEESPIKVICNCSNIPPKLDNDVALAFLRLVQESLHNVAKHSGAKSVQVDLTGTSEEISLVVRDDGVGFDVKQLKTAQGLGLVSMRERANLIGGEFVIDSTPSVGTWIRARVHIAGRRSQDSNL